MTRMSLPSRLEYLTRIKEKYLKADIEKKSEMLDECCEVTGLNRKYVIDCLSAKTNLNRVRKVGRKKRSPTYDNRVIFYLKKIWEVLDYPCGQRLAPMLPEMVRKLRDFNELDVPPEVETKLVRMSPTTINRKLERFRLSIRRRIQGTTKPGSLLKSQIPIRTSSWEEDKPGMGELDTVAHCGESAAGEFANTLNFTDILTGWSEQETFIGKAEKRVIAGLNNISDRLPFPLLGIDPDNGSEFINWQLFNYCNARNIEFTRGRPYKKNDNAHIEQKNWTHVRKVFGYERVEEQKIVELMNDLNRHELRLYKNFFQPTMKLVDKKRIGKHKEKIHRVYDTPATPYMRAVSCPDITQENKTKLQNTYAKLNPAELRRAIMEKLKIIRLLTAAAKRNKRNTG